MSVVDLSRTVPLAAAGMLLGPVAIAEPCASCHGAYAATVAQYPNAEPGVAGPRSAA
jgi:hypothetical protein